MCQAKGRNNRTHTYIRFELDEISPGACLPRYKAKHFDYELLSKPCQADRKKKEQE
jgi:hypothetical protein